MLRAQPHKTAPPYPHFRCQFQVQVVICASDRSAPPQVQLINLLEGFTVLRETFMFTSLLKDLRRDIDEQPDEKICRVRSGRVLSTGASVPVDPHPHSVNVFAHLDVL